MSLLSTLHLAKNALSASQLGIQVAANNIANADTPGYVRERILLTPAPVQTVGKITKGTGVEVQGVVRQVDDYLLQRMRSATSDLGSGEALETTYAQLETVIGELADNDLSSALTDFFNGLQDVLNQPETTSVRSLAVLRGGALAEQIRHLDQRTRDLRRTINDQVLSAAGDINAAVEEIAKLNLRIVQVEQGGAIVSDAVGLRDRRDEALNRLSELVNIQVDEQQTGAVNVFVGGDYLVFDGMTQSIEAITRADRDMAVADLRLSDSAAMLPATSGKLSGLLSARDEVLAGFLDQLDSFTRTLMAEFNRIHASSQGLTGFQAVTGVQMVEDPTVPLDEAGLPFPPAHGSFQVEVVNRENGVRETHVIPVRLEGLEQDTSLQQLVDELNSIDGLSASISYEGRLELASDSEELVFAFRDDTSGVLAALGVNTFFTGTGAGTIHVNDTLRNDPGKLALSRDGVGQDTRNGERLANLLSTQLDSLGGTTLSKTLERWMGDVAQASSLASAVAEGYRSFQATLEGDHLAISGVNLDEEAVNMITFQRAYQASARVITTVNEMLDVLVNL